MSVIIGTKIEEKDLDGLLKEVKSLNKTFIKLKEITDIDEADKVIELTSKLIEEIVLNGASGLEKINEIKSQIDEEMKKMLGDIEFQKMERATERNVLDEIVANYEAVVANVSELKKSVDMIEEFKDKLTKDEETLIIEEYVMAMYEYENKVLKILKSFVDRIEKYYEELKNHANEREETIIS